jgi:hypothetical protein
MEPDARCDQPLAKGLTEKQEVSYKQVIAESLVWEALRQLGCRVAEMEKGHEDLFPWTFTSPHQEARHVHCRRIYRIADAKSTIFAC